VPREPALADPSTARPGEPALADTPLVRVEALLAKGSRRPGVPWPVPARL